MLNMAQTTNYNFEIPDDTDLVKDGALAMRDLGQDVDTQLFTALGGDYPGLRLIKKQTIGSAVSSVTVTDAFSATYDNYLINISGGASSTATFLKMTLGATVANYYYGVSGINYAAGAVTNSFGNNVAFMFAGSATTSNINGQVTVISPNKTDETAFYLQIAGIGTAETAYSGGGFLNNTTAYTAFTITPNAGTLTGGTIYVYGYGAS